MPKARVGSRERLLQAAVKITYRYGFGPAAIADIAKEAKVPLGNVYYHFKTKNEIGAAVVDRRVSRLRKILYELDRNDTPAERLCGFVQIKINNRNELARSGCPVGTLCSELRKHGGPVAGKSKILFAEALAWMEIQFKALGQGANSRSLAVHLLSATQGVSLLAHTFNDARLIQMEATRLMAWIRGLATENATSLS